MKINKKSILIGIAVTGLIIAMLSFMPGSEKPGDVTEKIDRYLGISKEGPVGMFSYEHFFGEKINKDIADRHTVDMFKYLQFQYQNENLDDHYSEVLGYLIGIYGEEKAKELLELYKKFTNYEMALAGQDFFKRQQPASASEALEFLNEIKRHRESVFSKELADNLFGDEHRMYEYKIMQNEILKDPDMYGREKENEISALQENLGYKPDVENEMSELDKYNLKLSLYKKDFSQLNADQQKDLKKKFRSEIFTPEEASRLEQMEWSIEQEELLRKGIPVHD